MQNHHFSYPVFTRSGCLRGACAVRRCQTSASHLRMAYTMKKMWLWAWFIVGFSLIYIYIYVHRYKIHMHTICKSYIVDICSWVCIIIIRYVYIYNIIYIYISSHALPPNSWPFDSHSVGILYWDTLLDTKATKASSHVGGWEISELNRGS
jgi:hypothetical protein